MRLTQKNWMIVGIFLWGIPTGIFLAMLLAALEPGKLTQLRTFETENFLQYCLWTVPLFGLLGIGYGYVMNAASRRSDQGKTAPKKESDS